MRKIGISHTAIARVITEIRNRYEHQYILPTKDEIEAYYETTELWMNNSYNEYGCNRIGIVNLPISDISIDNNEVTELVFPGYSDIIYFWDHKKTIVKTKKDGSTEVQKLDQLTWKEILNIERAHIRALSKSRNYYYLPQKEMTQVFHFYNKKIPRRIRPIFGGITLSLKKQNKHLSFLK